MNSACSIELLESALQGNLVDADEAALQRHLDECDECAAAIERLAGGPAWCQEAAALLTVDELDATPTTRDEWSAVDFTVEHLEPADDPSVLGRLGGYDVLEVIGHGGMGVVLKAFDRELKRCVAIKVLAPHLAQSSLAKKRFAREAQAAAAIVHPNVLAIHQVQPNGRLPFLVMPLVAGESLAGRLTAQGTLELKEILRIGMQAAAGLAAAHEQGLVHRDVKPANILLEKGIERAVLTDFGLARAADDVTLTRWGVIAGTPQYMSPEQARGEPLDGRSDLFSLGCVLYEMATGVSPFRTDSMLATLRRLVDDAPQSMASIHPELPPWFIAIVDRLLEKNPAARFNSAKEVSELLEGCLAHVQQPQNVPLPAGLAVPATHRKWRPPAIGFKGVFVMLAAIGLGLFGMFMLAAAPPDISGNWQGEDWGRVVLTKAGDSEYTGSYSDTFGKTHGEIHLKWSRIERRFNGTWSEGDDRFGELSVRLTDHEIRGALTTDAKSKINPATPRLADLTWSRDAATKQTTVTTASIAAFGPVIERVINFDGDKSCYDFDAGKFIVYNSKEDSWSEQTVRAAGGELFHNPISSNLNTLTAVDLLLAPLGEKAWADTTPEAVREVIARTQTDKVPLTRWSANVLPGVYAFALLKGVRDESIAGILEVIGTVGPEKNTINGVGIRYKLVLNNLKSETVDNSTAKSGSTFGPVIEHTLNSPTVDRSISYVDLESGKVVPLPAEFDLKDTKALSAWVAKNGVDGVADTSQQVRGLLGFGLHVAQVPDNQWEQATRDSIARAVVEKAFQHSKFNSFKSDDMEQWVISANTVSTNPKPSRSFAFRTRNNSLGILQLLEQTDEPGGFVKFRYKLLQDDELKIPALVKPATVDGKTTFGPVIERVLPSGVPCREQLFQFRSSEIFIVGNGPGTSKEEAAYDEKKIDEAGGADMSANSGKEGIHIAGRGCIFTQDVPALKWESITAEQVVHAMNRVRFVNGIVEPRTKDLPITYLFKTARGEVGILEVTGVSADDRDDGGHGMKFRYKLVQGAGTSTVAATPPLVFGPQSQGLQAAVEVAQGEPFNLRIHVRNASDRSLTINGAHYRQDDECILTDAQGQNVPVTKVTHDIKIGMKGGYFGAGQIAVFESAGLSFLPMDKAPASAGYVAKAKPGRYTLRFRIRLPGAGVPFAPGERAWKGELETGPVTIEVKDPSMHTVTPVADSIFSAILGPVVEREMNDLQTTRENCALSFDSGKLLPVPANITLETLINPLAQPAGVAWARDNQVDAVAFVTIQADKVVKCGLYCPGLVVLRATSKDWIWDDATPRMLKEEFDRAMHSWKFISQIAEVTSDDQFPANYLILDTRTHRRGVLQIMGVADNPRSVKIRYRLVEGAGIKATSATDTGVTMEISLSGPEGAEVTTFDDDKRLTLPGRLTMHGQRLEVSITRPADFEVAKTYRGSFQREPIDERLQRFLEQHAIPLHIMEDDFLTAARGKVTKYIFLPHQKPNQKWTGQYGELTMGVVPAEEDVRVRDNLKKKGELLVVFQLQVR